MIMPMLKSFEQIHWNKVFCAMYGLTVMLSILTPTTSKNIDKIKEWQAKKY